MSVRIGADRVANFVEGDGAEFDAAFEHGRHTLRVGFVFIEPGEFKVRRGEFFGDDLVDEILDSLLGRIEALGLGGLIVRGGAVHQLHRPLRRDRKRVADDAGEPLVEIVLV
jgi:hypothetical protein